MYYFIYISIDALIVRILKREKKINRDQLLDILLRDQNTRTYKNLSEESKFD